MSAGWPWRWTGRMAFVLGDTAAATARGSRLRVSGSTSTNTGRAPVATMARAVKAAESDVVITSSPGPTPRTARAS